MPPGQEGQLCRAWGSLYSLLPPSPALPLWGLGALTGLCSCWEAGAPGVMWEPSSQAPEAGPV